MSDKERLVNFTLLGQEYSFYTGATEEEISRILDLVGSLMKESGGDARRGTIPVSKTAILACLNIASRYIKLEKDFAEYKARSNNRTVDLINRIDAVLPPEKRRKGV